jgi:hypothetical protein
MSKEKKKIPTQKAKNFQPQGVRGSTRREQIERSLAKEKEEGSQDQVNEAVSSLGDKSVAAPVEYKERGTGRTPMDRLSEEKKVFKTEDIVPKGERPTDKERV